MVFSQDCMCVTQGVPITGFNKAILIFIANAFPLVAIVFSIMVSLYREGQKSIQPQINCLMEFSRQTVHTRK